MGMEIHPTPTLRSRHNSNKIDLKSDNTSTASVSSSRAKIAVSAMVQTIIYDTLGFTPHPSGIVRARTAITDSLP